jgi:lactoylglutathione lyase
MKIEHVAIYVADLEKAKDFFIRYFDGQANGGYQNHKTGFRSYFISFDNGTRLELMNKPDVISVDNTAEKTGYAHIAFSVGSKEKVDKLTERLKNDGYSVISKPRTTGDGYYESCIFDIEGNRIEITV